MRTKRIELEEAIAEANEAIEELATVEDAPKLHGAAELAHYRSTYGVSFQHSSKEKVADTAQTIAENALKVAERGDKIEQIQDATSDLSDDANTFAAKAKRMKEIAEKKNSFF